MPWSYRPALDGLRIFAVYFVVLFHAGLPWANGGFIGVDLFFVLSGFLVTNVILSEVDKTGGLHVGNFYTRRVRRLLPAALVMIVATSLIFVLFSSVVRRLQWVGDAQSALLYGANWHFLGQSSDYFAKNVNESPFLHFWSLSIEEQFYFIFPLLLLLVFKVAHRKERLLFAVLTGLFVLSLGSQIYWAGVDTSHAYYGTEARLYQLLAGALLAIGLRKWSPRPQGQERIGGAIALTGLVGLLILGSGFINIAPSLRGMGATAVSVLLIVGLMWASGSLLARFLSRPVPVFLGRISYGTYLWHWPVILVLAEVLVINSWMVAVIAAVVSTGLAAASYEVLEMPIRKGAFLNRFRWTPAVVGVSISAVVALTLVPWVLQTDRRPSLVEAQGARGGFVASGKPVAIPADVDWSAIADDVGKLGSCTAADVSECTVVEGSGEHILLIGDSQAQMLVPMFETIAKEHDLTLSLNVKAGCLWQEGLDNYEVSADNRVKCAEARVGWYDEVLPKLNPDVVILVQRARDNPDEWQGIVKRRDGAQQPLPSAVYDTTRETLAKISAVVPNTVIVQNLVMPETFDPSECLASAETAAPCAVPVPLDVAPSDGFYLTAAAQSPTIHTVDLNAAFCPSAPVCQAVVDDMVVWRDDHHYTAEYAIDRQAAVWKLLAATGAFKGSA